MQCYFDGSTGKDDGGGQWLTLAGYMASDAFWVDFQLKWERMLQERYPMAPWLHMWELLGHEDPFTRINGWTDDKISELVVDGALGLLQSLDKKAFRAFVYSIDVTAHARLGVEGYRIGDPSTICAHSCIGAACDWYSSNHDPDLVYIYYDRGETFFEPVRRQWLKSQNPKMKIVAGDFWGWVGDIHDANMRVTPAIQAADLIAWARSRELSNKERPYRHLAQIARQVIPHSFWMLDEETMRKKYSKDL